jgi:hypothetical protein
MNVDYDVAVQSRPKIIDYLRQDAGAPSTSEHSKRMTVELANWTDQLEKTLRAQPASKTAPRGAAAR